MLKSENGSQNYISQKPNYDYPSNNLLLLLSIVKKKKKTSPEFGPLETKFQKGFCCENEKQRRKFAYWGS